MQDHVHDLVAFRRQYSRPSMSLRMAEDATEDDAYAVQDALIQQLGWPISGWKVGATDEASRARLGLTQAFVGAVFVPRTYPSGTQLQLPQEVDVKVECELAVTLAQSYSPQDTLPEAALLLEQIERWQLALELITLSHSGAGMPGGLTIVADNGGCEGLVVGSELEAAVDCLRSPPPLKVVNGEQPVVSHPIQKSALEVAQALRQAMANVLARGHEIPAGTQFATGHLCGILPLAAGSRLECRLGTLASVSVSR